MAEFTTEKRRSLTSSSGLITDKNTLDTMNSQLDLSYVTKIKEDKTNNEIFRQINSELTGLAFEYRYLNGKYHAALDEVEMPYKDLDTDGETYITKSFWDNLKLQSAANLEDGNEFHLNVREGTKVSYPVRPDKYGSWVADTHQDVFDFETTEANLIAMVNTLDDWYTSGGGTGDVETIISGEYLEQLIDAPDLLQPYMPVGYAGYQESPSDGYMTAGYNVTGEIVLINGTDSENMAFGKVVASRDLPSRILFAPYGKVGTIPDDAPITSTFGAGTQVLQLIAEQVILKMKWYYQMTKHYLDYNPNSDDGDDGNNNAPILTSIVNVLQLIDIWENVTNKLTFTVIRTLISNIEAERNSLLAARISYINSYLGAASSLYTDRFNVLDLRLSKVGGTLKELMTYSRGVGIVNTVLEEQDNASEWYKKYFIVKKARRDGDYFRRIVVDDFDPGPTEYQVGDVCYILTDDETVPEIMAEITHIVNGRLVDLLNSTYDEEGNADMAYVTAKKIFFKGVIFNKKYLQADNFRIIKQI
jgi:hypothetical protein